MTAPKAPSPATFFKPLVWLDGRPLLDVIEPYRQRIFDDALYTFDDDARPRYNMVLAGRGKKNWKTADLILAALYRLLVWPSPQGNDGFLLANDQDQASDDLKLAKKIIEANPILARELDVRAKELMRLDGRGTLRILPAGDIAGSHGKTYLFIGFDEIHAYRNWDLFEALAPDPTRPDALTWITSYASIFNAPGAPLYDLEVTGRKGSDPRMLYSWYSADYTTDPDFEDATPEERANPSMDGWPDGPGYLEQQRLRLPSHKYRRLHLNLPGLPDGAAFDAAAVMDCIADGRKQLPREPQQPRPNYTCFVDMSGGSSDDAVLAIAHKAKDRNVVVLDVVVSQTGKAPFNPRHAVKKFAGIVKSYGCSTVVGDAYAGETFRADFSEHDINYRRCSRSKSELYEQIEPKLNAREIELLDIPKLQEQLLTLVWRGTRIDHLAGDRDDFANAAVGALIEAGQTVRMPRIRSLGGDDPVPVKGPWLSADNHYFRGLGS